MQDSTVAVEGLHVGALKEILRRNRVAKAGQRHIEAINGGHQQSTTIDLPLLQLQNSRTGRPPILAQQPHSIALGTAAGSRSHRNDRRGRPQRRSYRQK